MKLNLNKIDLKEDQINGDIGYLHLLRDLGVLDDLENWPLHQEMENKSDENLTDEVWEKYCMPVNNRSSQ